MLNFLNWFSSLLFIDIFIYKKKESATHDYLMKIVPTIYENTWGNTLYPYQFTVSF